MIPQLLRRPRVYYPPAPATPALPNPDYGPNLLDWMKQPVGVGTPAYNNGGPLYLPDWHTYYVGDPGNLSDPLNPYHGMLHPFDATLPVKGWLPLKAWVRGSARVDLSIDLKDAGGALLTDNTKGGAFRAGTLFDDNGVGDLRTILWGLTFNNGEAFLFGTRRLRTYYTDWSFTVAEWKRQYDLVVAATGITADSYQNDNTVPGVGATTPDIVHHPYFKGNGQGSGFVFGHSTSQFRASDIMLFGDDIHDNVNDGVFLGHAQRIKLRGTKIWNIDNLGTSTSIHHNDSIQYQGGEYDIDVDYAWLGQHLEHWCEQGSIQYSVYGSNIWLVGSSIVGASIGTDSSSYTFNGSSMGQGGGGIIWFLCGQGYTPSFTGVPSDWDKAEDNSGSAPFALPRTFKHGMNGSGSLPSGVTATVNAYGVLKADDITQIRDHALNPGNVWRASPGQGYEDCLAFMAANYPLD